MNRSAATTFALLGLGCKVAQYDAEALAAELEGQGLRRADDPAAAGLLVVNTCTVTARADYQARQLIRRLGRLYPQARIVVTGCYAERDPQVLREIAGVEVVVGRQGREGLGALLAGGSAALADEEPPYFHRLLHRFGQRSRPFLKIQDGCDEACAYCIVPAVRGPSRSLPWAEVERQLRVLAGEGFREVVLAGVHLGRWGRDLGGRRPPGEPSSLATLLEQALALGLPLRLRLSSLEPLEMTEELLRLAASSPSLAPHFHLPLQSGSDRILRRMNRPYSARQYVEVASAVRRQLPEACLGADVLVGFPGETEEDFLLTERLVAEAGLDYLHVFPFSPRPGTPAAAMPGRPPGALTAERGRRLRELSDRRRREYATRFVGRELEAVVLSAPGEAGAPAIGLSGNYLRLEFPGEGRRKGEMVRLRAMEPRGAGLSAVPA